MLPIVFLASLCLKAASAWPLFPGPHSGQPHGPGGRALYIQDNDPAGNNTIAAQISNDDGKLSNPVKIPTGGKGLARLIAASQDSVVVSGDYVFAVNAGDDTLSVFKIDPNQPTNLQLLGKPASTKGHTPVSVTYSEALNIACALNAGDEPGVACFALDQQHGLKPLPFFLDIAEIVPSPPPGPLVIAADIRFNPSSTALFVTVTGGGALLGDVYSWPIHFGKFSNNPNNNTLEGITLPFSLNFLGSDSKLFLTNPHLNSDGAALLDIATSGEVAHVQNVTIPGQVASCWATYDPTIDSVFVIDAGRPVITIVDADSGKVTSQYNYTTSVSGTGGQDTKVDRNFLYVLTVPVDGDLELVTPPQVLVYDVSPLQSGATPREVQSFDILQIVGKLPGATGLAIYPAARFT
ncbi:hypothetical protein M409DRAFT_56306 [Zasmidium cellare ATCC 36951]|uniref:3-carboxymuconate cyclase n=1 Tax=Zasmidium cellare ATCC 36951 TaxID=1080233 RepID=A0A6A6CCZ6_ZASCE|nr:uncharacterized protein M409DRAFT_56306 [Zasmidium cellare ATCC 36951]KAF2164955.1 hypothetical protein M409DRAFT_56306 [Zasmidium cellare ATCC 36951]